MPTIRLLDPAVSDRIAAGEVVERPSSVVKELVENALDAGASTVGVEVERAGRSLIRVSDDGSGMAREDLELSVLRHATSKIASAEDLERLGTFGFRGEALPSIASVCELTITTHAEGDESGWRLGVDGGRTLGTAPAARARGTTVEARGLFRHTPARLKFLKSDATESGRMLAELSRMALARPDVGFTLVLDGRTALEAPRGEGAQARLARLWGGTLAAAALPVDHSEAGVRVHGWVAPPALARGARTGQWLYVHGRLVEHRQLGFHLSQAYGSLLPHGRHPVAALFIEVPSGEVDVNVHPAKREVRFLREAQVLDCLRHGVERALGAARLFVGTRMAEPAPGWPPAREAAPAGEASRETSRPPWAGPVRSPQGPAEFQAGGGAGAWAEAELLRGLGWGARPPGARAEESPEAAAAREDWPVFLAQLHRSYLLCQDSQGLVVVDQHAAHERVLYERQLVALRRGAPASQKLLLPQRLELAQEQVERLEATREAWEALGLEMENVGKGMFFVTAIPELLKSVPMEALVGDLADGRPTGQPASGEAAEDLRREVAARMACRAAVKAGDALSWEDAGRILADLSACAIPWSCPHGRPPLVRVTLAELERSFQRR